MKIGFVSAILDGWTFEEMMETAAGMGYQCVEAACWPDGKAERRYAGVSHIDVDNTSHGYVEHIKEISSRTGVAISALAYYPNTMDSNLEKREAAIAHLKKVICFSQKLGVGLVTTFIGREQTKSVEENLETFRQVWPPIIRYAEEHDVKIAVENCPMLFGPEQWPGGQNLFTTPALWRTLFDIIPSRNFGINYDPSHFVWQMMDYIQPIYEFSDRIFHVHYKDIKVYPGNWPGSAPWPILWNTWRPSFRGLGMWTGDVMCPRLPISGMTGLPAWRWRTGRLKQTGSGFWTV